MEHWPPFVRRGLALALLMGLLAALLLYAVMPIVSWMRNAVEDLQNARFQQARLEAMLDRDPPPRADHVPPNMVIVAPHDTAAQQALQQHLGKLSATHAVTMVASEPVAAPADEPSVRVRFTVTGEESALRGFLSDVEGGRPVVWLRSWRLQGGEQATELRFEGTAVAAWRR